MCYGDGASRAGARTLGSGDADAARGAFFGLPHITGAMKLLRWVQGETPSEGWYADDGWWLVSLAGKGPVTWAVYDDGGT